MSSAKLFQALFILLAFVSLQTIAGNSYNTQQRGDSAKAYDGVGLGDSPEDATAFLSENLSPSIYRPGTSDEGIFGQNPGVQTEIVGYTADGQPIQIISAIVSSSSSVQTTSGGNFAGADASITTMQLIVIGDEVVSRELVQNSYTNEDTSLPSTNTGLVISSEVADPATLSVIPPAVRTVIAERTSVVTATERSTEVINYVDTAADLIREAPVLPGSQNGNPVTPYVG